MSTYPFLTHHPFLSYENSDGEFIAVSGDTSFDSDDRDISDLWNIGKRAFDSLGRFRDINHFDEAYQEHGKMIEMLKNTFKEQVEGGNLKIVRSEDNLDPVNIEDFCASDILNLCWNVPKNNIGFIENVKFEYLFACLSEIDHALVAKSLSESGVIAATIAASNNFANYLSIESGNESLQKVRSEFARESALKRHANSPKQKDKISIQTHWKDWRENPDQYSSKAEFARDMLDAYENLTSQKKIEDWCRDWEKGEKL